MAPLQTKVPWHSGYEVNTDLCNLYGRKLYYIFKTFLLLQVFFSFYFCTANIENIILSPNNFPFGSTSTSDRPFSRYFGLGKVLKKHFPKSEKIVNSAGLLVDVDPTKNRDLYLIMEIFMRGKEGTWPKIH